MGGTILVQPDGRLALFSSIVDCLTVYDATDEELITYLGARGREDAEASARRAIEHVRAGIRRPGEPTWEEAVTSTLERDDDPATQARFIDGPNTPAPPPEPEDAPPGPGQSTIGEVVLNRAWLLHTEALAMVDDAVARAREQGLTWVQIGRATGMTRQSARERWNK